MRYQTKAILTTAVIAVSLTMFVQILPAQQAYQAQLPVLLAQMDEGDIDESYDSYGPDLDEEIEYDEALMQPKDSTDVEAKPEPAEATIDSLLKGIRWLGHASFLIETDTNIYVDPYDLSGDPPPADIILITHDHSDHFSPDDIATILKPSTVVVSIDAVGKLLSESVKDFRSVKPGDEIEIDGIHIEVIPAYNIGKRFHPKDKGYVGFVVDVGGRRIYHAGDTDLIPEMKDIDTDIALLPIGGTYTMDASEAAAAAEMIQPQVAVPMHWGKIVGSMKDASTFRAECSIPVVILKAEPQADELPEQADEQGKHGEQ